MVREKDKLQLVWSEIDSSGRSPFFEKRLILSLKRDLNPK